MTLARHSRLVFVTPRQGGLGHSISPFVAFSARFPSQTATPFDVCKFSSAMCSISSLELELLVMAHVWLPNGGVLVTLNGDNSDAYI